MIIENPLNPFTFFAIPILIIIIGFGDYLKEGLTIMNYILIGVGAFMFLSLLMLWFNIDAYVREDK